MASPPKLRSNAAWLEGLRGHGDSTEVIRDLERILGGILRNVVAGRLSSEMITELTQESITRILASLGSFRGDSAFTTWAAGIATRVAFTEFRRRQVREDRQHEFDEVMKEAQELADSRTPSPLDAASRSDVLQALRQSIDACLTDRQRTAILAELRGIPTLEIATRLGITQNALYKLTHDARKKLRAALGSMGAALEEPQ